MVAVLKIKRWRCTVCNYIHVGNEPPDPCPECGVGPEFFELLDEVILASDESTNKALQNVLFNIQYGLFVVAAKKGDKINGQICNTLFQITSSPLTVAVGINKFNLTHDYIASSGSFTASVLGQECLELIKLFGYQSGRTVDKFKNLKYHLSPLGNPYLKDNCTAYFECKVMRDKTVDMGTHTLFIAEVISGEVFSDQEEPVTYYKYRLLRSAQQEKVETTSNETKDNQSIQKWECQVCGYIHHGENPPDECPVCGVGPDQFRLLS